MPKQTLEAFAAERGAVKGPACFAASLPEKVRAQIDAAPLPQVPKVGIPHTVIAEWLESEHFVKIGTTSVSRHRKKKCRCR